MVTLLEMSFSGTNEERWRPPPTLLIRLDLKPPDPPSREGAYFMGKIKKNRRGLPDRVVRLFSN